MKIKISTIMAVVIIFKLLSCKTQQKDNIGFVDASDTLFKKTIVFPQNLLVINNQSENLDSFICRIENKRKIISIVDGICIKCIIHNLNKTDSLFSNLFSDDDLALIYILNVSKKDSIYFRRHLEPEIKTSGTILWDNNYNFERQNKLFTTDVNKRTFMLNTNNNIIQYGNPIMHPDLKHEYIKKMKCP